MDAADIVHVQQLLHLYGHIVDAAEWDRFDELFLPDAVLDYTAVHAPEVFVGIDAIRAYFERANHPSAHHVVNVHVAPIDGALDGELRVKSKFFVPFTRATHEPHRWYGGDYDDVVVPSADGWRFRYRRCTERWQFSAGTDDEIPQTRRTW